jgi:hypothetical protein
VTLPKQLTIYEMIEIARHGFSDDLRLSAEGHTMLVAAETLLEDLSAGRDLDEDQRAVAVDLLRACTLPPMRGAPLKHLGREVEIDEALQWAREYKKAKGLIATLRELERRYDAATTRTVASVLKAHRVDPRMRG